MLISNIFNICILEFFHKFQLWILFLLYVVSMTKAYVLIDPLTGRSIDQSPTIQENKSQQQFFDEQSQLLLNDHGKDTTI